MDNNVVGSDPVKGKTSVGLDENIEALLCYLGLIGLIFYLIEKDSKFVKFHGLQSTFFWVPFIVIQIILGIVSLGAFVWILQLLGVVFTILGILKAYKGERYKFPVIGDMAEKQVYGA
ncbi:MAG: hypothetical protein JWQ98_2441 [Chlorobi bacterium]|nr:hypothetical protein [Chlorobiota bacterium]